MQRVGGELGGVALGHAQSAELAAISSAPICAATSSGVPRAAGRRGAARGDRRAAAAGVKAGVEDPPVAVAVQRERNADQIAARGSAGRASVRARRGVPAPERSFQMRHQARCDGHLVECMQ